jgi:hypothetical protein
VFAARFAASAAAARDLARAVVLEPLPERLLFRVRPRVRLHPYVPPPGYVPPPSPYDNVTIIVDGRPATLE